MLVRRLHVRNFRGFLDLPVEPDGNVVVLGPPGSGRSDLIEALGRVLDTIASRTRATTELDFHNRNTTQPIQIALTLADLGPSLEQRFLDHLELWDGANDHIVVEAETPESVDQGDYEWVLRLEYWARWLPDEERCEEWVHYPKDSDPDADFFVHARRSDIEALGFGLLRWSGGKMLDLGGRSAFRRVIERANGGDFAAALDQYVSHVAEAASQFTDSAQIQAALKEVVEPLQDVLGLDPGDPSELDQAILRDVLTLPEGSAAAQVSGRFLERGPEFEREGFDLVIRLGGEVLPAARDSLFAALDDVGLNRPETIGEWKGAIDFLTGVESTLKRSHPEIYKLDFEALHGALSLRGSSYGRVAAHLFEQGPAAERETFDLGTRLGDEVLPKARDAVFAALDEVGLTRPEAVVEWEYVVAFLSGVEQTLGHCSPIAYELDLASLRDVLAPAGRGGLARMAAQVFSKGYRSGKQTVLSVHKEPAALSSADLLKLAEELDEQAVEWKRLSARGGNPRLPSNLKEVRRLLEELVRSLDELGERGGRQQFRQDSHTDIAEMLATLQSHWEGRQEVASTLRVPEGPTATSPSVHGESNVLPPIDLLELLEEASEQANEWRQRGARAGDPRPPSNLGEATGLLEELLHALDALGERGGVRDFDDQSHTDIAATLAALTSHWEGRQEVASTVRAGERLTASDALELLDETADQKEEWKRRGGDGTPRVPSGLGDAKERVAELVANLDAFANIVDISDLQRTHRGELAQTLERLAAHPNLVASLPRIRGLEQRFRKTGISRVMERVGETIPPELAVRAVEHAWLRRVLDDLEFDDQRLSTFDGDGHSRHRDEFAQTDRQHLDSTPQRVHRLTAEAIIATMSLHPEETALVRKEAAKKRRHLSVRQLFAQAPHVLSALRPCWTMSPVLAAEMIPLNQRLFDVVIFDEASQIPPAEAIGSLARASQAVVAGDSRQLPPTSFFGRDSAGDEPEEQEETVALTADIESLLDVADALLRDKMLQWHYRSRDDRLIAFSNNHIYGGSLTAFPGAIVDSPISHCLIPFRPITGGTGTHSNPDEVDKVVDLVLEHARDVPRETLGVIAFGQHHADNIENALMRRLGEVNDPSLDEFFSETNEERFFVKNIERVQGDERDVIILSVGYHKDANGNLPYRFGPILHEGEERRLNVAVTRARSRSGGWSCPPPRRSRGTSRTSTASCARGRSLSGRRSSATS